MKAAHSAGRPVAAHAIGAEGMRRATMAGVDTIEHGDDGTLEVFKLMKSKGVAFCPTVAAGDAVSQYQGWHKGVDAEPDRIKRKRESMKAARDAGVTFIMGGDVGVFAHGDNAREMELLVHEMDFRRWKFCVRRQAATPQFSASTIAAALRRVFSPISSLFLAIPQKMSLSCVRCTWS